MPGPIVDIHPHIVSPDTSRYPVAPLFGIQSDWSKERKARDEDLIAAMDDAGVAKTAIVHASTVYGFDNSLVADAVAHFPQRCTAVGSIDMLAPDAADVAKQWISRGLTGFRIFTGGSTKKVDASTLDDARSYPVWELCSERGLSICVQTNASGIPATIALAKRFPKVPIIVDHFARPDVSGGPPFAAAAPLMSLAAFSNVYLKLTPVALNLMQQAKADADAFLAKVVAEFGAATDRLGFQLAEFARHAQGTCCCGQGRARFVERGRSRRDPGWNGASALSCPERQVSAAMPVPYPSSGPVTLKTNLADSALSAALKAGRVSSPIVRFDFCGPPVASNGFKAMVRDGAFDAGELAIVTFLQAKTYGKPLTLLPATVVGRFQHNTMSYMDRGKPMTPKDLEGRRVAVRAYTQTTGAWARGILQHEYGVDLSRITWLTTDDPHLAEFTDPANVVRVDKREKPLDQRLIDGEADAGILGPEAPKHEKARRLIPDHAEAAQAWHAKYGCTHINHMFVLNSDLARQRPDVVSEVYRMLAESKAAAGPPKGVDALPFGVPNVARSIEIISQYANEQGIIPRPFAMTELFDETTRQLGA